MNPLLRKIGHRFFPWLVAPYRRVLFKWRDLRRFPADMRAAKALRDCSFAEGSEDYAMFRKWYAKRENRRHGHPEAEGIIWMGDGRLFHGGPTDRLRGILTSYEQAKRLGVPFHIHWTHPFPLTDYLLPAGAAHDWRISPDRITYDSGKAFPVIIMETKAPQTHIVNYARLRYALQNRRKQIHLYSNADNARGRYAPLYRELFKPSPLLAANVAKHRRALGPRYRAFTFRFLNLLGDFTEHLELILPPGEGEGLIERVTAKFKEIAAKFPKDERILVTSDSGRFLRRIAGEDARIYIVDGDVKNIDMDSGRHEDAWLKTFTDQQLLMEAEEVWLLRTGRMYRSGFPRFAAEIGGHPFHDCRF